MAVRESIRGMISLGLDHRTLHLHLGAGFTTANKEEDEDEDEDLDIEDDDVEYGTSQYNELDIMVNSDEDNEDTNALREMISGGSSKQEEGEDNDDDDDDDR